MPRVEPVRDLQELEPRLADAQAEISARDEFIAVAAHELRNPMSAVLLIVQQLRLAASRAEDPCPERVRTGLDRLGRRVHDFVRRAGSLLDATRILAKDVRIEREPVDLAEVARELVTDLAGDARLAGCAISLAAPTALVGWWDRNGVEQVLSNLLSNAIKYGAGRPIDVRVLGDDDVAKVRVRDRGIGIAPADQARIFAKFERAGPREHTGFGVGLWVSARIVEAHGGRIEIDSTLGQGAVFTVTLPRAAREDA